ncbi:hypothetical protein QEH42_gp207 [Microbacterium phage Pumpernickel]|uniref:Uncharacterized protein n=1 Tax=Microbacterium phage Pumpernickel TaxID=2885983 RepID=A0AAE8Y8Q4_9CAUD|nr:hypothetical protein QEH42_gp207 [Microbacterium phage Pumpernickel]UDL16011.1 hypothetical protein SEA_PUMPERNICKEL_261 [Microbacterium phage Pumpernickel]
MNFGKNRKLSQHSVRQAPPKPYATVRRTGLFTYKVVVNGYLEYSRSGGYSDYLVNIYEGTVLGRAHAYAKSKRILARHLRKYDRSQEPIVRFTTKDVG